MENGQGECLVWREKWRIETATESGGGEALGCQTSLLHLKHGYNQYSTIVVFLVAYFDIKQLRWQVLGFHKMDGFGFILTQDGMFPKCDINVTILSTCEYTTLVCQDMF